MQPFASVSASLDMTEGSEVKHMMYGAVMVTLATLRCAALKLCRRSAAPPRDEANASPAALALSPFSYRC